MMCLIQTSITPFRSNRTYFHLTEIMNLKKFAMSKRNCFDLFFLSALHKFQNLLNSSQVLALVVKMCFLIESNNPGICYRSSSGKEKLSCLPLDFSRSTENEFPMKTPAQTLSHPALLSCPITP